MRIGVSVLLLALVLPLAALATPPAPQVVDLKSSMDGTPLKATYYSAGKPGPGALLLHQGNRSRKSWDEVARRLAAAGINALTLDIRLHGDSGGTSFDKLSPEQRRHLTQSTQNDADAGFQYLVSRPGVDRTDIGIGMAGAFGVVNGVETARRHAEQMKSLVFLSGETTRDGLQYMHGADDPPGLFVVSDSDEYPPTVEAMELLYATSSNPGKRFVRYAASQDAPWLWYETSFTDQNKVPSTDNHGTDLFKSHTDLPGLILDWFTTTLIKTPGHARADGLAAADIYDQLEWGGSAGVAQVTQQLTEARSKDPQAQLFPEISVSIIGQDYMRVGDVQSGLGVFKLVLLAYPDSADNLTNLADAYHQDGQDELARQAAEKALAILDAHKLPASSWSDTDQQRGEIRQSAEDTLKALKQPGQAAASFRDCPDCPEMQPILAGHFTMGSSDVEKAWAVSHGATADSVSDEAPQHTVTLKAFALGKYDVTRGEYAAFVKETGYVTSKACYENGNPGAALHPDANWEDPGPGLKQTDRDPVVCVDWRDAKAYVAWLNSKTKGNAYRLPSESEWEYAARGGASGKFWWGEDDRNAADYAWFEEDAGGRTRPVGEKAANAFGLYDMGGDVWQWTEDCYGDDYSKAPVDGSAAEGDASCMRSARGSSWFYPTWLLRVSTRERNPPEYRDLGMGFRVAKTLP